MRILIATSWRNMIGGVERYLQALIPGLLKRGHSVGLLYEFPWNAAQAGIDDPAARLPSWCAQELGAEATWNAVARWSPDVAYAHGLDDSSLEGALVEKYPTLFYGHTYHGTCVSGRKCHAWPRLQPCSRELGPQCMLLYFPRRCGGLNPATMWHMYQQQTQRKARLRRYQAVLVASRHMRREFERHGVSPERLHLVPLPANGNPQPVPLLPRPSQGRILFVGRLMDVKGVRYLLEAIPIAARKLARPLSLTIAGDGPERARLQNLAERLGIQADFTGWVDEEQRLSLVRQSDLLAMPSLWPEPFGLSGIEAGCLGVPAVGYAVGGIPDWLVSGRSGELAPGDPPTINGLAEAIVRALQDPDHYATLCLGAWEMAMRFSLEAHLANLESILMTHRPVDAERAALSDSIANLGLQT